MKRHIIVASHSNLASGMVKALKFFSGDILDVSYIDAYVDNQPIDKQVKELVESVVDNDEIIIFTDLLGGSVNQQFYNYVSKPHTHLITGMNLPIVLSISMETPDSYLDTDTISRLVEESKQQIVYMNNLTIDNAEDE
jgi:mannose PTS system EIIA component